LLESERKWMNRAWPNPRGKKTVNEVTGRELERLPQSPAKKISPRRTQETLYETRPIGDFLRVAACPERGPKSDSVVEA